MVKNRGEEKKKNIKIKIFKFFNKDSNENKQ